jgi:putative flippase GtrA
MSVTLAPSAGQHGPRVATRISARTARLGRDLLVYLVCGGTAAAVNLVVGWLLYRGTVAPPRVPYWCATTIAAACGLLVNFLLNHAYFRFRQRSALGQFGTFAIVAGVGVLLTGVISQALLAPSRLLLSHDVLPVTLAPKFAAHVAAVGLVVLYSFPAHRFISFNVGFRGRLRQLLRHGVK